MANPIQKTDLISDEALRALEEMSRLLREDKENMDALMASFKQYAGSIQPAVAANNSNNDALTAALQKVSELEKAYSDLQRLMKENAATQKAVAAEKRKYAKLTEDEAESVKRLSENVETYIRLTNSQAQSLKGLAEVYAKNIVEIDIQKKSYNELYQTYNALKDALNKMTVEERLNTEAGKKLTEQSLKIRDTLNELQKSTGNYTLQVGKYRAAFDGLGYSFQQILREAPSALNLQQFFLAISNNIPLFIDQLKAFKNEQKEIAENLKGMTEGTKEYQEQMSKQMTVGQKLTTTLFSWQTAVLGLLLIIRKIDFGKLFENIKNFFSGTSTYVKKLQEATFELSRTIERDLTIGLNQSLANTEVELGLIIDRMSEITQGSDEWIKGVQRINELTGKNLSLQNDTIAKIKEVTNEYLEQSRIIAQNEIVIRYMAQNKINRQILANAQLGSDIKRPSAIAGTLGLTGQTAKDFIALIDEKQNQIREYRSWTPEVSSLYNGANLTRIESLKKEINDIIASYVPLSDDKFLESLYQNVGALKNTNGTSSNKEPSLQNWEDRYWEMEEARIATMEDGYEKEIELERIANLKALEQNEIAWDKQLDALDENLNNDLITREEYDILVQTSKDQHDKIQESLELEHQRKLDEIFNEYQLKRDKKVIESIENQYKSELKVAKRRVKTVSDEKQRNADLIYNIRKLEDEQELLRQSMVTMGEDGAKIAQEKIDKLTESIKKYHSQLQFDKQLSNYKSVWDIFQRNGFFEASPKTMRSILGGLIDGFDKMDLSDEELSSIFDKLLENAGQAVSTWYTTTKDYINDLIDAYIELANAKADAAKEATDAAQEEYEKEKALLEAGYANRVETMWSEYQQKKAIQEQAEKDAAAAAAAQKQLNEIETAGSLITASANIWKAFGQWPPLAIAAIATMWGSFLAAKAKAAEVSKYGEGDVQLVGGGSHASGHDTLLGYSLQGREMRVENGEVVGIIPRRSVKRLGEQNVLNTMRALRDGTFEANAVKMMDINRNAGNIMFPAYGKVDLSKVERSLNNIDRRGETQTYIDAQGNIIEKKSNGTTKYIRRR